MSSIPFDIIALIIDIVGENKDTNLLKELTLVSHSFLQICSKHLFATVELYDTVPNHHVAFSKKRFVKLLKNRPDVAKYIRTLMYNMENNNRIQSPQFDSNLVNDDDLLSPILPNILRTISRLNCLTITGSFLYWNTLDSSLISALLHLMHLPTINHIELSFIKDFPLSSLTSSVNLHRLNILFLTHFEDDSFEIVQSETPPNIREFHTSGSDRLTTKLLDAKRRDGRPAFNFTDLRRLSISSSCVEDERKIRYLLQNAKLLEKLHLSIGLGWSLVRLHDILSSSTRTLKVLDLSVFLYDKWSSVYLGGLCEELEALAGHNMLEAMSFKVHHVVDDHETEDYIGSVIQKVERVLVKPGWSALREVSIRLVMKADGAKLSEALQSLPDKYLTHLSKLESVAFGYSTCVF